MPLREPREPYDGGPPMYVADGEAWWYCLDCRVGCATDNVVFEFLRNYWRPAHRGHRVIHGRRYA